MRESWKIPIVCSTSVLSEAQKRHLVAILQFYMLQQVRLILRGRADELKLHQVEEHNERVITQGGNAQEAIQGEDSH